MKSVGPLVVIIVVLFLCGTAHATVWYVHPDSTMNCIQDALDSCSTGDTVLVGPGTYYENIGWPSTQGIDLISEYWPDTTIIDGDSVTITISIVSGVDSTTIIHGFTIQGGFAYTAGGIYCSNNSSPTIDSNVITKNVSEYGAGGIECYISSPIITNNTITDNTSWYGGGIGCEESAPTITANIITLNTADSLGGGIVCGVNSSPTIDSNIIMNNVSHVYGGGIACWTDCSPIITGNIITGNTADGGGGGIACMLNSSPTITYNTITTNDGDTLGGGIAIGASSPLIEGCEISNNVGDGVHCLNAANPVLHNNNIFGNTGYGVCNESSSIIVDAESNWWGDSTGPYHPTANPGGLGDSVSDYVDFDPWLTGPGVGEQPIVKPVEKYHYMGPTVFYGPLQLPTGKKCKVFDITGRIVEPDKIQPGIYFIEVDGVVTQKVVKVR
jgi:parallel beta-helix repeat protein